MTQEFAYDKLRWPEVRDLPKSDRVAVLPVGATEQHGQHLPLDTDNLLVSTICVEAARRAPEDILLLPLVSYGYCGMMMDYPGTISIEPETLISYLYDIVKSLARHGFERALIVNGHGGNRAVVDVVSAKAGAELSIACASVTYWNLITQQIRELRESEIGGICHACEMETSIYLHLDRSRVKMDKGVKDIGTPTTEFFCRDFAAGGVVYHTPRWSTFSQTGVFGDPSVATAEKGEKFLNAAADRLVALVKDFKAYWPPARGQR